MPRPLRRLLVDPGGSIPQSLLASYMFQLRVVLRPRAQNCSTATVQSIPTYVDAPTTETGVTKIQDIWQATPVGGESV